MPLRDKYGRAIFTIACLGVAVAGGALVGTYSVAGMNPIYTQSRERSTLADNAGSGNDLSGARPVAYAVADPADEPPAYLAVPSVSRDLPAADTPGF